MARDRQIVLMAEDAADILNALCIEFAHGLSARIYDSIGDMTASRAVGSTGAGIYADPTAARAIGGSDVASRDRAELERCIRRAHAAVHRAWDLARRYPEPHHATDADRADLERINGTRADGCQSCARLTTADGLPRWEPIDSRRAGPTDVGGRLPVKAHLCRWCADRVQQWGRWPNLFELEDHHAGKRVHWPADVERPR